MTSVLSSTADGMFVIKKQEKTLLQTIVRMPLPIKFIKFGTFEKSNVEYFYDCISDKGNYNNDSDAESLPMDDYRKHIEVHSASIFNFATMSTPIWSIYGFIIVLAFGRRLY